MTATVRNGFPQDARSAAEFYLAKGLAPIPLPPRSKDPGYAGWPGLRLTTDTLDGHFPPQQARNVGILNGSPSGNVLDVDLDCSQAIRAAPMLLPESGWVFGRKSAPGSHRIYRADRLLNVAQEKYTDIDGATLVELRGTGGLTVYPPSTHKDTGEQIAWEQFDLPADVTLTELQRAVREVAAVALLARHWPAKGTRQDAFLALAGGLLLARWAQNRAERFVDALAAATRDEESAKRVQVVIITADKLRQNGKTTGWPKLADLLGENGKAVVGRVREWLGMVRGPAPAGAPSTKKLRTLEPFRPFPVEALPAPIGEYVRQGALALGCDPAYLALPALAVAASVIGNTRTIRLKRDWHEPSIIWSVIVGDSGTLKSPAYLKAVAYLFRVQKRLLKEFKEAKARYEEDLAEYKKMKQAAKDDGTGAGDPPEKPVFRRVILSDITIQKLAEILEDNPRGVLVARDELAAWFGSFKQFKGKSEGSDLPNWLEMYRAGTVIVDRKTGDRTHYFVERAAVSITGGIQPGVLVRALTTEFLDAGGGARIIMAMPPKIPKQWSEMEIQAEVEDAYHAALDKLLGCNFDVKDGEKVPYALRLSADAKAAWVEFYNRWAMEQAAVEGELAAAFSKLEAYAARFTLLHHVVGRLASGGDDLAPIEQESVEAGVTLCRWFANEARRIYSTLTESDDDRDTRRLVEFIRSRGGSISVRALQNSNSRKYPAAEAADATLEALAQAGLGNWDDRPPTKRGGRPTRCFTLHPTPDKTDTTPDDMVEDDDTLLPHRIDTTSDTTMPTLTIPHDSVGCVGNVGCRLDNSSTTQGSDSGSDSGSGHVIGRPQARWRTGSVS